MIERLPDESNFNILERLAGEGYLQNNQQFAEFESCFLPIAPIVKIVCSMKNLEQLDLHCDLTLEDLAHVFQSCSKLEFLSTEFEMGEMDQDLINHLRPGFQRLRQLHLFCLIDDDTWPGFQEMLTSVNC
jgi:hypothetical protein